MSAIQDLIDEVMQAKAALDDFGPERVQAIQIAEAAEEKENRLYDTYRAARAKLSKAIGPGIL